MGARTALVAILLLAAMVVIYFVQDSVATVQNKIGSQNIYYGMAKHVNADPRPQVVLLNYAFVKALYRKGIFENIISPYGFHRSKGPWATVETNFWEAARRKGVDYVCIFLPSHRKSITTRFDSFNLPGDMKIQRVLNSNKELNDKAIHEIFFAKKIKRENYYLLLKLIYDKKPLGHHE